MKKTLFLLAIICSLSRTVSAAPADSTVHDTSTVIAHDTVRTGIYITSIHNIDFRMKEYTMDMWLWMRYRNKALDFWNNMEIPQAKTVTKSFATIDSSGDDIYMLMKLQCVMKDSWRINNFPFDDQVLRFSLENSQFDSTAMVFVVDTLGKSFDERFAINGWKVQQITVKTGTHAYQTAFGDKKLTRPYMAYSAFKAKINIGRDALGLFFKMFLGMYMAFLAAYMCFYIHIDNTDSRFSLSVGGLFAVVGNKYIVDASLPESLTFTLVDLLHGISLFFIVVIIVCNVAGLRLNKAGRTEVAVRFNKIAAQVVIAAYILLNALAIIKAQGGF